MRDICARIEKTLKYKHMVRSPPIPCPPSSQIIRQTIVFLYKKRSKGDEFRGMYRGRSPRYIPRNSSSLLSFLYRNGILFKDCGTRFCMLVPQSADCGTAYKILSRSVGLRDKILYAVPQSLKRINVPY